MSTRIGNRPALTIGVILLALSALQAPGVVAQSATAQLRLAPGAGPPTTSVLATGRGFGSSEVVDVTFDQTGVGTATTTSQGSFSLTFAVPSDALPGTHSVTATGQTSGKSAQGTFRVRTDWSQFAFEPSHSGLNPYENVLDPATVGDLMVDWTAPTAGAVDGPPVVVGGRVYVGSSWLGGAWVLAFDAAAGRQLWKRQTGAGVIYGLAVQHGIVYATTLFHELFAFDAITGELQWVVTADGAMNSPTVSGEVVYVNTSGGYVDAFDARLGSLLWRADTGSDVTNPAPALAGGVLYVATGTSNTVMALDAATGNLIWTTPRMRGFVNSSPSVQDGVVYVGSGDHRLYALDAATGTILWKAPTGDQVNSSPAVVDGVVYVGSDDDHLYAFDAATGVRLWSVLTAAYFHNNSPTVANGVVYAGPGGGDGHLYAVEAATGTVLWTYQFDDALSGSAIIADGRVYAGPISGRLYAFALP